MLWTNKKFGKTGARRVLGSVLLFLLCGLFSLSCSLPASAATTWTSCENNITAYTNGLFGNGSRTLRANVYIIPTGTASSGQGNIWRIAFQGCNWTNSYSTFQHFTAAFSVVVGTPNGSGQTQVWSNGVQARDNQNDWSVEQDIVTSSTYQSGSYDYIVFTHNIQGSIQPGKTIDFDFNGSVFGFQTTAFGEFDMAITDLRVGISEDVEQASLQQLKNQNTTLTEIKALVENIKNNSSTSAIVDQQKSTNNKLDSVNNKLNSVDSDIKAQTQQEHQDAQKQLEESKKQTENQQATNDKLDREYNQDQQDRSDAEDAVDNSQTSADDSQASLQNSSQSLLDAMGATVNLIRDTPATNCKIPIDTGNLDLGEVDLCSVPNDVKQLINRVFGLVMIVGGLLLSLNIFHSAMDLFAQATGYSYNPPTVTGGKK